MPHDKRSTPPGTAVIEVRGLRKNYYGRPVLDGVDLAVERGEVFAILGPNGAGKTTMVEILEGFRRRSAGQVAVLGEDPAAADRHWRARIGVVPQDTGSFDELTVTEIVRSFADFYAAPLPVDEVIELVGLAEKAASRALHLSGGQQRRLDVALGIIGDPELIFLDEPTTGLDPQARRQAWELVRRLTARGATVVLTTHYLDEVEALANRVAVLVGGQIAEVAAPSQLGGRSHGQAVITFRREGPLLDRKLPELTHEGSITETDGLVAVSTAMPAAVLRKLIDWCWSADILELPELVVSRPSLEDTYLKMISTRLAQHEDFEQETGAELTTQRDETSHHAEEVR
jgi:ABC-2 type transport system ATP-binding protein